VDGGAHRARPVALVAWAVPVIAAAVVLWTFHTGKWLTRSAAALAAVYGVLLLLGAHGVPTIRCIH